MNTNPESKPVGSVVTRDALVYAIAHKHGLLTEALQAAWCTLSYSTVIIESLAVEDKLGLMPGASLHELWKYH